MEPEHSSPVYKCPPTDPNPSHHNSAHVISLVACYFIP